jgi:hypothetical protein
VSGATNRLEVTVIRYVRNQAVADKVRALRERRFPDKDLSWAFPGPGQERKVSTCRK